MFHSPQTPAPEIPDAAPDAPQLAPAGAIDLAPMARVAACLERRLIDFVAIPTEPTDPDFLLRLETAADLLSSLVSVRKTLVLLQDFIAKGFRPVSQPSPTPHSKFTILGFSSLIQFQSRRPAPPVILRNRKPRLYPLLPPPSPRIPCIIFIGPPPFSV